MNSKKPSRACCFAVAFFCLIVGCDQKVKTIESALAREAFPVFGVDGYSLTVSKLGRRNAPGSVLTNCVTIDSLKELSTNSVRIVLVARDDLARDFLKNECSLQTTKPNRPNIPLQFLRKETFVTFYLNEESEVTNRNTYYWQNIKVFARGAK